MNGWIGRILRVNLSLGDIKVEALDKKIARDYIGGRGLGIKYLYDEIDPMVDPLGPENKLIFATGPLTGTGALAAGRYMVVTKAPLTGAIANSNAGGYFPAELKFAGYDMIIFEGRAKSPCYLWIENDNVELRNADEIWGKDVNDTTDWVVEQTNPEAKVACIGPAGENQVLFASIMNDKGRAAGRSGVGAVMGSKKLKAIVVTSKGNSNTPVADLKGLKASLSDSLKIIKERLELFGKMGTPGGVVNYDKMGNLPFNN